MRGAAPLRSLRRSETVVSEGAFEQRPFCYRPSPRIRRWSNWAESGPRCDPSVSRSGSDSPTRGLEPPTDPDHKYRRSLGFGATVSAVSRRLIKAGLGLCDAKNFSGIASGAGFLTRSPRTVTRRDRGRSARRPSSSRPGRAVPTANRCSAVDRPRDPCLEVGASVPFPIPRLPGATLRTAHFSRVRGRLR